MTEQKFYLKPNVVAEPLFNQWYAWSYLIPPATAAMHIANSHLKIMKSFCSAPQVHISALKNPEMMGGPFINYDESQVGRIRALMEKTIKEQANLIEFAEAMKVFNQMLISEATGYSLESFYERVPHCLRGYIELVYDLNNNPSIRLIEGLLYRSSYYNQALQSILLWPTNSDRERSFVLSTPRIEFDDCLHLQIPFSHEGLDDLFEMRNHPGLISEVRESLEMKDDDKIQIFNSFFTEEPPHKYPDYLDSGIRIRYFGHASVLIESKNVSILCDPMISYQYEGGIERYTYVDLPESIDYVLITHNHQDHCVFETLLQLRPQIKNVIVPKNNGGSLADPSLKLILQNIGFKTVIEIDEMESIFLENGAIIGLPFLGEHTDLNIRTKSAYLVHLEGKRVLLGADSNNIEPKLYEYIHDLVGNIDLLFLGMECDGAPASWLYGPLFMTTLSRKMDQSRRLDGSNHEKGIDIVNQFNPKEVYVYSMGQEPWTKYLLSLDYTEESRPIVESNKLIEDCRSQGIWSERLFGKWEKIYE
jgi:L-ascorbate metabolism protein UlaG (beta-lactamase superfamily)